jgi:hypothetical protein
MFIAESCDWVSRLLRVSTQFLDAVHPSILTRCEALARICSVSRHAVATCSRLRRSGDALLSARARTFGRCTDKQRPQRPPPAQPSPRQGIRQFRSKRRPPDRFVVQRLWFLPSGLRTRRSMCRPRCDFVVGACLQSTSTRFAFAVHSGAAKTSSADRDLLIAGGAKTFSPVPG